MGAKYIRTTERNGYGAKYIWYEMVSGYRVADMVFCFVQNFFFGQHKS